MLLETEEILDYCDEISQLNGIINSYKTELAQLEEHRRDLLRKKQYADMDAVLEQIIELGLTANEVMEIISDAVKNR